jgi:hypothetical protein
MSKSPDGSFTDPDQAVPRSVLVDEPDRAALHIDVASMAPDGEPPPPDPSADEQVDPGDASAVADVLEASAVVDRIEASALVDLIEAFLEVYNAHDLDGTLELFSRDVELPGLGGDVAGFADAVARCWDERPHAVLTRGTLPDQETQVAVLWDVGPEGDWLRAALLCFELSDNAEHIGLVELVGDSPLVHEAAAEAPEPDLPEGACWEEWYEGTDGSR